jgi:hypothetical protein
MTLWGKSRYAAAAAALALAACGGGSDSSSNSPAPPTGGGGGGTPAPSPTPTPTPPPPFGFAASFAFVTPLGIEANVFDSQNISDPARVEALDARFLSPSQSGRFSFERSASAETVRVSFAEVDRSFVGSVNPNGNFRTFFGSNNEEQLQIGPFSPFFTRQQSETAEVAIVTYLGPRTGFTAGTRVGEARRVLFAVIGNPSVETGPIPVSKRFLVEGIFTGSPGIISFSGPPSIVDISSDTNVGVVSGISVGFRRSDNENPQLLANLNLRGAHDPVTNRLTGTVRNAAGQVVGTFEGGLYGPGRRRIGMVYEFTIPETGSRRHIGYYVGFEG